MKALLAAKWLPVRLGSQMCLNVRWVSIFFVFMQQKFHFHCVVVFFFGLLVTVGAKTRWAFAPISQRVLVYFLFLCLSRGVCPLSFSVCYGAFVSSLIVNFNKLGLGYLIGIKSRLNGSSIFLISSILLSRRPNSLQ